jgi:serine/threonine-protein kinase
LYAAGISGRFELAKVVVQRLDTGERKVLRTNAYFPRYLPSGHLLFVSSGTVYATSFDLDRLEARGTPVAVLQGVKTAGPSGGAQLDLSHDGTLVYRSADQSSEGMLLGWVDQTGRREELPLAPGLFGGMLSPDGRKVAFRRIEGSRADLWVYDFERKTTTRLTFDAGESTTARWSHDGMRLFYASESGLYWTRADGSSRPVRLLNRGWPMWVSPDGKLLGYIDVTDSAGRTCKFVTIEGDPEHPRIGSPQACFESDIPVLTGCELSPDGRWLLYGSMESGNLEVYVRTFPDRGGRWQISSGGGTMPRWSRNGRQVFYFTAENRLMVADVDPTGDTFASLPPRQWMDSRAQLLLGAATVNYSPSADGKRMLIALPQSTERKPDARVRVVLNFLDEITQRLQTGQTR